MGTKNKRNRKLKGGAAGSGSGSVKAVPHGVNGTHLTNSNTKGIEDLHRIGINLPTVTDTVRNWENSFVMTNQKMQKYSASSLHSDVVRSSIKQINAEYNKTKQAIVKHFTDKLSRLDVNHIEGIKAHSISEEEDWCDVFINNSLTGFDEDEKKFVKESFVNNNNAIIGLFRPLMTDDQIQALKRCTTGLEGTSLYTKLINASKLNDPRMKNILELFKKIMEEENKNRNVLARKISYALFQDQVLKVPTFIDTINLHTSHIVEELQKSISNPYEAGAVSAGRRFGQGLGATAAGLLGATAGIVKGTVKGTGRGVMNAGKRTLGPRGTQTVTKAAKTMKKGVVVGTKGVVNGVSGFFSKKKDFVPFKNFSKKKAPGESAPGESVTGQSVTISEVKSPLLQSVNGNNEPRNNPDTHLSIQKGSHGIV